jgi:RimJ/RimL family protein N-acetyltransferase
MSAAPSLTDGTVTLRAHRDDDVEALVEQCVDADSVRWTTVPTPYGRQDAHRFVHEVMPDGWAAGRWGFAVEAEGRYAGTVELRDEGGDRAEIAFVAHPGARGTGAMERACRLILDWGFGVQGVRTVVWHAHVGNWASRRLAWRLGFSFDGTLREYVVHRGGLLVDAWTGTLLASDERAPRHEWLACPVLEADGLRLRPWGEQDVPRIVEACRDPRTQQWLGRMPDPYAEVDARVWLEHLAERRATGGGVAWAVTDRDGDAALASVALFDLEAEQELEVGYWVHPDARGRGVMTRAVGRAVEYAFVDLGVRRVRAAAAVGNDASHHVLLSNGLLPWGTERMGAEVRGGRADLVWYDLLVEEWRSSRHSGARVITG